MPLGTVYIMAFNRLRVGDVEAESHQCTLSTYAEFVDSEFKVIDPETDNTLDIELQGGLMSKVVNQNITLAAGATYSNGDTTDSFEGKAKVTGLDRPNVGLNPGPVVRHYAHDLATAQNVDFMPVLDLYCNKPDVFTPNQAGTSVDEMSLEYLFGKETITDTVSYSSVTAPGAILYSTPITPCRKIRDAFVLDSGFVPDLLEYASLPFEFWRGDLIMVVEILASSINTGRVAVCTHFGMDTVPTDLPTSLGQYAHVFDLTAETNRFEVVLPFNSRFEWMRICHGVEPIDKFFEYATGLVSVRAISRLTYTPAVTNEVDINIYFKAAPNYEVRWLGVGTADMSIVGSVINAEVEPVPGRVVESKHDGEDIELQGGDLVDTPEGDQMGDSDNVNVAAPPGKPMPECPVERGHYKSINDLFMRFTKDETKVGEDYDRDVVQLMQRHPMMHWFGAIFKTWKGGLKVGISNQGQTTATFLPDSLSPTAPLSLIVKSSTSTSLGARMAPYAIIDGNQAGFLQFQVPFVSQMKFMLVSNDADVPITNTEYYSYGRVTAVTTNESNDHASAYLVAGSDDFRFSYLYRIPRISVNGEGYFQHNVNTIVVPASFKFVIDPAGTFPLVQSDITNLVAHATVLFGGGEVKVTPFSFTPEMYHNYLNIDIPSGAIPIPTGPEVQVLVPPSVVFQAVPSVIEASKGVVGPLISSVGLTFSPTGVIQGTWTDPRGVEGPAATTFNINFSNNVGVASQFALMVGVTAPGIYVPDGNTVPSAFNTLASVTQDNLNLFEMNSASAAAFVELI